ncbi:MAG: hypothetical protein V3U24_01905 [Candidatus Neomarinimicrobiota bacterium]
MSLALSIQACGADLARSAIILVGFSRLLAADSTIRGVVRDEATHQPLKGANVPEIRHHGFVALQFWLNESGGLCGHPKCF